MSRFNIVKKGYSIEEVENFISTAVKADKDALSDKAIRIDELKSENAKLNLELEQYRQRESSVNQALLTAIEKAKEMDYSTRIRFALEGERIKLFRDKWINYCDKKKTDFNINEQRGEIIGTLKDMEDEIVKTMTKDLNLDIDYNHQSQVDSEYLTESKRIIAKASKSSDLNLDNFEKEEKFNLNELNNPPNLEDLCKQLGLMI